MYAIWRACERFGVRPPGMKDNWEDMVPWVQTLLLAYDQIRGHEDVEILAATRGL